MNASDEVNAIQSSLAKFCEQAMKSAYAAIYQCDMQITPCEYEHLMNLVRGRTRRMWDEDDFELTASLVARDALTAFLRIKQ